jgi:L-lactate dehydrogenase complex protein LldG
MPAREHILYKVHTALGRNAGQAPAPAPEARLRVTSLDPEERIQKMLERFPGKATHASSAEEAREYVAAQVKGLRALASRAPILERLGIASLPEVTVAAASASEVRQAAAGADVGITTAEYGMADTGALVVLATAQESRLISLLPPVHITVLETSGILTGLDELFARMPDPGAVSSSMVFIGGPSRTADIEQILTLGVHGPREIRLVLV